jgi:hypothetical protein
MRRLQCISHLRCPHSTVYDPQPPTPPCGTYSSFVVKLRPDYGRITVQPRAAYGPVATQGQCECEWCLPTPRPAMAGKADAQS